MLRNCLICGKEFYVKPSVAKKGFGKYCGWECKNKGHSKDMTGRKILWGDKIGEANKRRTFTPEQIEGYRQRRLGENNPMYRGNAHKIDKHYRHVHYWIARVYGRPQLCQHCRITSSSYHYQWANISGEYRKDISDWARLCAQCHRAYDWGKIANLTLTPMEAF